LKKYEQTDHTADIGLKIFGNSLPDLFANAAYSLCDTLTDISKVSPTTKQTFLLQRETTEELLVEWMGNLLYTFETEDLLFSRFNIISINKNSLSAEAEGEFFNSAVHTIKNEVKAVTYHKLKIEEKSGLWQAEVVLDI
jgi:SHS2 domain-containing protein